LEAPKLRQTLGARFLVVTPGIRAFSNLALRDDQKRTVTAEEAFLNGADYIVVGRPITKDAQPRLQAEQMQETIRRLFG
jgi:orotidine-5'-phosphate decarboxylase